MTAEDREWIVAQIQQAILEERERTAKAAGMTAGDEPPEHPEDAWADFARRLRGEGK